MGIVKVQNNFSNLDFYRIDPTAKFCLEIGSKAKLEAEMTEPTETRSASTNANNRFLVGTVELDQELLLHKKKNQVTIIVRQKF